jgi:hypothetical protein
MTFDAELLGFGDALHVSKMLASSIDFQYYNRTFDLETLLGSDDLEETLPVSFLQL